MGDRGTYCWGHWNVSKAVYKAVDALALRISLNVAAIMKWCLALVAVSLWAVAAAQTGLQCSDVIAAQCPDKDDPGQPVFLPNPADCSQYCECSNGDAWLFDCPPGTLYDVSSKRCIMEVDVDCGLRPIP